MRGGGGGRVKVGQDFWIYKTDVFCHNIGVNNKI